MINLIRYSLTLRRYRLLIYILAFVSTFVLVSWAHALFHATPSEDIPEVHLEAYGLLLFMFIGLFTYAATSTILPLKPEEEDILLTLPMKGKTIVQSRLLRLLYITPLFAFLVTGGLLASESLWRVVDIPARFPFAFLSIQLFLMLYVGLFSYLEGIWNKYHRIASKLNYVIIIGIFASLALTGVVVHLCGPWAIFGAYFHPITRFILVAPLSAGYVFLGYHGIATIVQILCLVAIASAFLYKAFTFEYQLHELDVSPYQRTAGRGTERESPPLPKFLEKPRRLFHVRYLDWGTGSKAVFGYSYSRCIKMGLVGALLAVPMVWWMAVIAGGERFLMERLFLFGGLGTIFMSGLMAAIIAMGNVENIRVEIIQTLPIRGRSVLLNLISPGLFLLSFSYVVNMAIILFIVRMNPFIFFSQAILLAPVIFISTYVGQISTGIHICASFPASEEESDRLGMSILNVAFGLLPLFLILTFLILAFATENIAFGVLGTFLIPAISVPLAYFMFETAAQNLDALKPIKRVH